MNTQTKNSLLLLLCSLIWGTAFALYRYGSLFGAGAPEQAAAECAALRAVTGKET